MSKESVDKNSFGKQNRVTIIGIPISAVNMESCVKGIFSGFEKTRGEYICVSNVHTTVMEHDDPQYYKVQSESFINR